MDAAVAKVNMELDKILIGYEKKKVVAELKCRMDEFTSIEHIATLKNIFLPKIKRFSDLIDYWQEDNAKMKESIVNLDMDISLKANKS